MLKLNNTAIAPIEKNNLKLLYQAYNDAKLVGEFLPYEMTSQVKLEKEFDEHGFITETWQRYKITNNTEQMIGICWVFKSIPYYDALEVGYWIFSSENRSQGHATNALQLLVDHLFQTHQINRIETRMAVSNIASEKVAQKIGFRHEGIHRQAAFSHAKHHDMHNYALLRADWQGNKAIPF